MEDRSERFRLALKAAGINQNDLADRLGTSRSVISQIKLGKMAGADYWPRIADALKASESWLKTGAGTPPEWLRGTLLTDHRVAQPGEAPTGNGIPPLPHHTPPTITCDQGTLQAILAELRAIRRLLEQR